MCHKRIHQCKLSTIKKYYLLGCSYEKIYYKVFLGQNDKILIFPRAHAPLLYRVIDILLYMGAREEILISCHFDYERLGRIFLHRSTAQPLFES